MKNIKNFKKFNENHIITDDMLFYINFKKIIKSIEVDYNHDIQRDFDKNPTQYPDLMTWLELHPDIVGKAFMKHIIEYGITDEDLNESKQFKVNENASTEEKKIKLYTYKYHGGMMGKFELKKGDVLYVDSEYMYSDPSKKLLWGYDKNGDFVSGEFKNYYEKFGKPITFKFEPITKLRTANDIKKQRGEAIRKHIKSLK